MSNPDLEGGNPDGHSTPNQPLRPLRPLREESDDSDGSWTLYSIYSNIAEKEDSEMVERCQKYADGTLIFAGLFSATVAALLTISFADLKPNSQDTSAFYLENIYQLQVFSNPNVSHPSALAKPPAFSPPGYAVWVNSLWFLSLVVGLSGALEATLSRNWAVQYISVGPPSWDTLAERARTRSVFAKGNPGPYVYWGTSRESGYLHFSLLLFIIGSLIYLFNINRAVFYTVIWWIGYVTIRYTLLSTDVFAEPHILFHTSLSSLGLKIYLGIAYVVFHVFSCIPPLHGCGDDIKRHHGDLSKRYSNGIVPGKRRQAREIASKPSSEIDTLILERILLTLDEDPALETFFHSIPGFCNSKYCILPLLDSVQTKFRRVLDGFLNRTFSFNLVSESSRVSRLITCLDAVYAAFPPYKVSKVLDDIFTGYWDEALQSVEIGHALRVWGHRGDHDLKVQQIVACIIVRARQHDDRWIKLVKEEFGVPDDLVRDSVAHGDSVLLFILIHVSRQANRASSWTPGVLSSLFKLDICKTLPSLQRDFCTLWNEISQEARDQVNRRSFSTLSSTLSSVPVLILRDIRHIYIDLHRGTDAVPTAFTDATDSFDAILEQPSSYPLCDIASHHPDSTTHPISISGAVPPTQPGDPPDAPPHQPTLGDLRLAEETNIITGLPSPPDPSTTSKIGETAQVPTDTFPVHSGSPSLDKSLQGGVVTAQPDTTLVVELSRPLESSEQQGLPTPFASPTDISGILHAVPAPAPVSASPTPVLDQSSGTYEAGPAFNSKSSLPASSGGISVPDSHVPPLPSPEPLSLLSSMQPEGPSDTATLLRLPPRKVDKNMSLASTALQSLACCPPFRNLFRDLPVGRCKRGETGGGATPLIDATVRFLDEFAHKEKSSVTHQAVKDKVRDDEDGKREDDGVHSFLSTDVCDALKEKRQFTIVRDGWQHDAAVFLQIYLEALDEELVTLQSSIGTHKLAPTLKVKEVEEETQSGEGQTEKGEREYTTSSIKSPISRVFGGRSRSTICAPNQPDTTTVQDWRLLQLNIQSDSVQTVEDALTHISHPQPASQPVQVGQLSSSEESQQVQIEALPPVLVLHFKRFLYDATADSTVKISKPVKFAPELEIPLEIMAPVAGKSVEPAYYKLYGVLYHHGESASDGRYTVDVLRPNGDSGSEEGWLHIGEEGASVVRHEDVFEGHDNKQVDSKCAYMLIYCRAAPNQI